jgi:hypothetical protein
VTNVGTPGHGQRSNQVGAIEQRRIHQGLQGDATTQYRSALFEVTVASWHHMASFGGGKRGRVLRLHS